MPFSSEEIIFQFFFVFDFVDRKSQKMHFWKVNERYKIIFYTFLCKECQFLRKKYLFLTQKCPFLRKK